MFLFVSYSHEDTALAKMLEAELKKRLPRPSDTAEIGVWRDRNDIGILAGEEWRPAIDELRSSARRLFSFSSRRIQ